MMPQNVSGFAIINKPPGLTSSDVVVRVRRCFPRGTRVGHMGTLDPGAMGVLPVGIGKAARLFDYVIDKDKEYIAEMALGIATDTQDTYGEVIARNTPHVDRKRLEKAAREFIGQIEQIPPAYSAVKKDGKRLYQLAREGGDATVPPRAARIDAIEVLTFQDNRALLRVACGRGTYIRTLIHDIGNALGCGAAMAYLVRTKAGPFTIDGAVSPDRFRALSEKGEAPLYPIDAPLAHLPALRLGAASAQDVHCGRPLVASLAPDIGEGGAARVYLAGVFAGIAERKGPVFKWKAMLLEDGK